MIERAIANLLLFLLIVVLLALAVSRFEREAGAAEPIPYFRRSPITTESVAWGRALFFDPRLSIDGSISCATCHQPERFYTDGLRVSRGYRGRRTTRNAPSCVNSAYPAAASPKFWDGRQPSLEGQALQPLIGPEEMGNRSIDQVVRRLNRLDGHRQLCARVFGDGRITAPRMAKCLADFQRTLIATDTPLDRYLEGDDQALTAQERRGLAIFEAARCDACHRLPLGTDGDLHNTGVSFAHNTDDPGRRGEWEFKTPPLVGVVLTAPYFHAGTADTLLAVVLYYNRGGTRPGTRTRDAQIDHRVRPLGLNSDQISDLVAFLRRPLTPLTRPRVSAPQLP